MPTHTSISLAKTQLEAGGVVAIPTETVYGLAANALDPVAVAKIFEAKNRPFFDPLIVHVSSIAEIKKWTLAIHPKLQALLEAFSPGPLTVLLPKNDKIPDLVTSGLTTVGIRIPNHPLTLELLSQLDFPLCAPSANPFGYVSPTTAQHVADQLGDKIDGILDGGACTVGVESTIVGIENDEVTVYRLGGLAIEAIEKTVGKMILNANQNSNPQAPGMLDAHYAPRKPLLVGDIARLASENKNEKMGLISFENAFENSPFLERKVLSPQGSLTEAASKLFEAIRALDQSEVTLILAEHFPDKGLGRAINDRLKRASVK
jgi:L-threonylcarbamoyladenylate synthase